MVILHRRSNPDIKAFMSENNMSSYGQLGNYFFQNVIRLLDSLNSKFLVWEEVFLNGVTLPNNAVIHVREDGGFDTLAAVSFFFPHERQKNELLTFR
jgi:hexosaminidase